MSIQWDIVEGELGHAVAEREEVQRFLTTSHCMALFLSTGKASTKFFKEARTMLVKSQMGVIGEEDIVDGCLRVYLPVEINSTMLHVMLDELILPNLEGDALCLGQDLVARLLTQSAALVTSPKLILPATLEDVDELQFAMEECTRELKAFRGCLLERLHISAEDFLTESRMWQAYMECMQSITAFEDSKMLSDAITVLSVHKRNAPIVHLSSSMAMGDERALVASCLEFIQVLPVDNIAVGLANGLAALVELIPKTLYPQERILPLLDSYAKFIQSELSSKIEFASLEEIESVVETWLVYMEFIHGLVVDSNYQMQCSMSDFRKRAKQYKTALQTSSALKCISKRMPLQVEVNIPRFSSPQWQAAMDQVSMTEAIHELKESLSHTISDEVMVEVLHLCHPAMKEVIDDHRERLEAILKAPIEDESGIHEEEYGQRYKHRVHLIGKMSQIEKIHEILAKPLDPRHTSLAQWLVSHPPKAVIGEWMQHVARMKPKRRKGMPYEFFTIFDHMSAFEGDLAGHSALFEMRWEMETVRLTYEALQRSLKLLDSFTEMENWLFKQRHEELKSQAIELIKNVDWSGEVDSKLIMEVAKEAEILNLKWNSEKKDRVQITCTVQEDWNGLLKVDWYAHRELVAECLLKKAIELSHTAMNLPLHWISVEGVVNTINQHIEEFNDVFKGLNMTPFELETQSFFAALFAFQCGEATKLQCGFLSIEHAETSIGDVDTLNAMIQEMKPGDLRRIRRSIEDLTDDLKVLVDVDPLRRVKPDRQGVAAKEIAFELKRLLDLEIGDPYSTLQLQYCRWLTQYASKSIGDVENVDRLLKLICQMKETPLKPRHLNRLRHACGAPDMNIQLNKIPVEILEDILKNYKAEVATTELLESLQDSLDAFDFTDPELVAKLESMGKSLKVLRHSPHFVAFATSIRRLDAVYAQIWAAIQQLNEVERDRRDLRRLYSGPARARLPEGYAAFAKGEGDLKELLLGLQNRPCVDCLENVTILESIGQQFTSCRQGIEKYLEDVRARFPRFAFLGDEDVVNVLGLKPNELKMDMFGRLFDGLSDVEFAVDMAIGVRSKEGEWIPLKVSSSIDVVDFLIAVHDNIRDSMRSLFTSVRENLLNGKIDESHPHQLIWICFLACEEKNEGLVRALKHEGLKRLLLGELYAKSDMVTVKIPENEPIIRIGPSHLEYGWEYGPVPYGFLRAPLNDGVFFAASTALEAGMGLNPFGPAGTGKTESVKALARLVGRPIVVFCCDGGWDPDVFSRIFRACLAEGFWTCFDEFNRLPEAVMSTVSEQIEKALSMQPVFITTNPRYAARQALPPNLTHLFVPFAMRCIDLDFIIRGWFCQKAISGAEEVIATFKKRQAEEPRWDWGLRTFRLFCLHFQGDVSKALSKVIEPRRGTCSEWTVPDEQIGVLLLGDCKVEDALRIAPNAILSNELIGSFYEGTWHDGILTRALRSGQSMMLDGGLHPRWIESLNNLLDDNRCLSLPTGEILHAPSRFHVYFRAKSEAEWQGLSMATLSRCMVVRGSKFESVVIEEVASNSMSTILAVSPWTRVEDIRAKISEAFEIHANAFRPAADGMTFLMVDTDNPFANAVIEDLFVHGGCWMPVKLKLEWIAMDSMFINKTPYCPKIVGNADGIQAALQQGHVLLCGGDYEEHLDDILHWPPSKESFKERLTITALQLKELKASGCMGALDDMMFVREGARVLFVMEEGELDSCYHQSCHIIRQSRKEVARYGYSFTKVELKVFEQVRKQRYQENEQQKTTQLRHLQDGLGKIEETAKASELLRTDIIGRKVELAQSEKEAHASLELLVQQQSAANALKDQSSALHAELRMKLDAMNERKSKIDGELAKALPAMEAARAAVKGISKAHLQELRAMANPPEGVRNVLLAVCNALYGKSIADWREVQGVIRKEGFIADILQADDIEYDNASVACTVEAAYRASRAAGPLLEWLLSASSYARLLREAAPLRNEVAELNIEVGTARANLDHVQRELDRIQADLASLEMAYAKLVAHREEISNNLKEEELKLKSSQDLLDLLHDEIGGWERARDAIEGQNTERTSIEEAAFVCGRHDKQGALTSGLDLPSGILEARAIRALLGSRHATVYDPDFVLRTSLQKCTFISQTSSSWIEDVRQAHSLGIPFIWIDDYVECSAYYDLADIRLLLHCSLRAEHSFAMSVDVLEANCTDLYRRHKHPEMHLRLSTSQKRKGEQLRAIDQHRVELLNVIESSDRLLDEVPRLTAIKAGIRSAQADIAEIDSQTGWTDIVDLTGFVDHAKWLLALDDPIYAFTSRQLQMCYEKSLQSGSLDLILWDRFGPSLRLTDRGIWSRRLHVDLSDFNAEDCIDCDDTRVVILTDRPLERTLSSIDKTFIENLHLQPTCNDMLNMAWVATCDLHRPPPKSFMSQCRTIVLEDSRPESELVAAYMKLTKNTTIATTHARVRMQERHVKVLYPATLDCIQRAERCILDCDMGMVIRNVYGGRRETLQEEEDIVFLSK